jgi:hypothetical protein
LPLVLDYTFPHAWKAEVLTSRPLILPARQFVYPALVEEVERGALEIMIRPSLGAGPFLATCALGFAGDNVPSGIWACPDPAWICAVAGGYAYLIDTSDPARWEQLPYRPVTNVTVVAEHALLVFAGFQSLLAWGRSGKVWDTGRLSWDGLRVTAIHGETLLGLGWDMTTDRELEFNVNLKTGEHRGGGYLV